ncbi:hypothetical protein Prudu_1218S000100 [Prunus dulcis]|uniref:Transposase-associated domain-containing protein n=1 Tax=Prunus dulcis TaxID=3755 RepID=A0A5H2XT27_PRUDU|nr:hypothetical protein Prudu_1218S000100 [Prunus dulcis]
MVSEMDKSWMHSDRRSKAYEFGVEAFLNFAVENLLTTTHIRCPCVKCVNLKLFGVGIIRDHVYFNGIDQSYKNWTFHGEPWEATTNASRNVEEDDGHSRQHMIHIKTAYPKFRKRTKWLQDKHNSTFIQWLRFKVQSELEEDNHGVSENLRWLAAGPNMAVPLYRSYLIKGIKFNIKAQDDVRTTQNSGVYLLAHTMQVASAKDKNPILSNMGFYGSFKKFGTLTTKSLQSQSLVLGDVIIECEPFTRGMPNVDTFDELVGELGSQNIRGGVKIYGLNDAYVLATKQSVQKILDPDYIIIFCIKNDVCSNKTRRYVNHLFSIFTDVLKQRNNEEPRRYCGAIIQDITSGKD